MSLNIRTSVLPLVFALGFVACEQPRAGADLDTLKPAPNGLPDAGKDCDGSASFYDVEDTSTSYQALAEPVGVILNSSGSTNCTGALISANYFLTAGHCADTAAKVRFNYQYVGGSLPASSEMPSYDVLEIVDDEYTTAHDYAILKLDGEPGLDFGWLTFDPRSPDVGEALTIIHHPGGMPKKISEGNVLSSSTNTVSYDVDTLPGSSGAPVLDADGKIIAVHTTGSCSGTSNNNSGHRADAVWDALDELAGLLPLAEPFRSYGGEFALGETSLGGGVTSMSGLVRNTAGTWSAGDLIAQLPEDMWPDAHLILNANHQDEVFRVDVGTDGEVYWVAGDVTWPWVSLSGLSFDVDTGTTLSLGSGFKAYGAGYRTPSYSSDGARVKLSGLVRRSSGSWTSGDILGTLPTGSRPSARLIFNVNQQGETARVDVYTNGDVVWVTGSTTYSWVSLDGVDFQVDTGTTLSLSSGKSAYGAGYGTPSYTLDGEDVILSGLVKRSSGSWSSGEVIGTLPAGTRPSATHIFNVNQHGQTARVDVNASGQVKWMGGDSSVKWVSLDGIRFKAE